VLKGRAMKAWEEVSMYSQGPGFRTVSPRLNIGRESRVGQREVASAPLFCYAPLLKMETLSCMNRSARVAQGTFVPMQNVLVHVWESSGRMSVKRWVPLARGFSWLCSAPPDECWDVSRGCFLLKSAFHLTADYIELWQLMQTVAQHCHLEVRRDLHSPP
jgi:hypothetical protein